MKVALVDFSKQAQVLESALQASIGEVFRGQQFILGSRVKQLEERMAVAGGTKYGIGVASGSDALYLTLAAMGVGPGDQVITTPFTFFATVGSIVRTGAEPVFADVDPKTYNLDPQKTAEHITAKTKAILPVHLFGLPAEMDEFRELAKKSGNLRVVEDAAQATGAEYRGRPVGSLADAACLSFFPTKNLGAAGDAGMVLTSDETVAQNVRMLRVHGSKKKYHHEIIGINSRLDELQAAVLLVKEPHLIEWNRRRRHVADIYLKGMSDLPLQFQAAPADRTHVYHLFSFTTENRDGLAAHLQAQGVGCGIYYPLPLHLQKCFEYLGYRRGDCPVSEKLAETILSVPMYPEMTDEEADYVVRSIRSFFGK